MIGIGFIGIGGMGSHQAKSFAKVGEVKIVAGADVSEKSRAEFQAAYADAKVYADYKDLLKDSKVDAVVIAVPTGFHAEVAIDALNAGRHVLAEKPMARTVAECRKMIDVADKAGKVLMAAHCRRFDPNWGAFASTFREGKLGKQILWRHLMAGTGPGRWFMDDRLGGGPLLDGAIHDQDFANWIFGDLESVSGAGIKLNASVTAVDTGSVVLQYRNGCQLLLSWSWARSGQHLHDALGTEASFIFGKNGLTPPEGKDCHCFIDASNNKSPVVFTPGDMYVNQGEHFRDCIVKKIACLSPGTEAIKAVASAEAALKVCREGGVVRL